MVVAMGDFLADAVESWKVDEYTFDQYFPLIYTSRRGFDSFCIGLSVHPPDPLRLSDRKLRSSPSDRKCPLFQELIPGSVFELEHPLSLWTLRPELHRPFSYSLYSLAGRGWKTARPAACPSEFAL